MAVSSIKRRSGGPIRSNIAGLYATVIEVEISTTTITSNDPQAGFTVAHAGTDGDYTLTFDGDAKPRSVWAGMVLVEEDQPGIRAHWTGYTASTGIGTFTFYDEDNTSGIEAQADFTGTAKIVLLCSDSKLAD